MVSNIPSGLLTCRLDGVETGIVWIAPDGIQVRVPEKLVNKRCQLDINYYCWKKHCYENYSISHCVWKHEKEQEFFWTYEFAIESSEFADIVSFVCKQYYEYIVQKTGSVGQEFSEIMTGYPSQQDDLFARSYEEWKQKRLDRKQINNLYKKIQEMDVEVAVKLEQPICWQAFLEERMEQFWDGFLLSRMKWIYVGNAFCHNLFPDAVILFQILEKAREKNLGIVLEFSYLREEMLESIRGFIRQLDLWCTETKTSIEIQVNDWGMLPILGSTSDYIKVSYGILLNKRRKDPRYRYKNGYKENQKQMMENQLNQPLMQQFVKNFGIQRLEYETCGYPMEMADFFPGKSLHLPMYQTNTSQYCTLYALCSHQNRGKQALIRSCIHYCQDYVCVYPEHLDLVGRYNSLFAWDSWLLEHLEILEEYKKQGMDRIVWNLI